MAIQQCDIILPSGKLLVKNARWCNTFTSKLKGFMFQKSIAADAGLVLVQNRDSKMDASIHMLFVPFDLGVVWVNSDNKVVDTVVAKSWRPNYSPKEAAKYVIEIHPDRLNQVNIGDTLTFNIHSENN